MKKVCLSIAASFCFILLSFVANAQTKTGADYFAGKWDILVKGLPNGDTKMIVSLDKKDSTLTGSILDSTGTEISKFSKVDLSDSTVTVYFTAQGYDVYLRLDNKGEDHVTGSMMDMFDAEGDRTKEVGK